MKHLQLFLLATMSLFPAALPTYADSADGRSVVAMEWNEVVALARGSEVNWFMWGGADNINAYVSNYVGKVLRDNYDIKLNRIGVTDTVEVVNIVLGEKQAGVSDKGAVDMIWINGENFRSMKQGELAWCGYTNALPNNKLVNWENPAIANDFGVPVEGCEVPWNTAQFAFAYDSATLTNPPMSIPALIDWIKANPGQFTYPAPPDFNGSAFIRHMFYHAAGGAQNLLGPFDQKKFDVAAENTWKLLNELEPYLWRKGRTYPTSITQLNDLFANKEISLTFNYDPSQFGIEVQNGKYPDTVKSFGLTDGTIANTNYTLIPFNSPHKAAALVLQNVLLSADAQLEKARPEVWGTAAAIAVDRTSPESQKAFSEIKQHPSVISASLLAKNTLPELQSTWLSAIEKGWLEHVGK